MTTKPFNADAVHEIDTHLAQFGNLAAQPADLLLFVGDAVGTAAESFISPYAPVPNRPLSEFYTINGKPSKFKTLRAQRGFFARLKSGEIKVPYVRTGDLGRGWTRSVAVADNNVFITLSTTPNVQKYAGLVIGDPATQSHYHRQTGWHSARADIDAGQAQVPQIIENAISQYVAAQGQQP